MGYAFSLRRTMFGFQVGESANTVVCKTGYIKDAQQKWRFLTKFDCPSETERQLGTMTTTRSGIEGKQFRAVSSISEPK